MAAQPWMLLGGTVFLAEQHDAIRVRSFLVVGDTPTIRGLRKLLGVDENQDCFEP